MMKLSWVERFFYAVKIAGIHLSISVMIAALTAVLVFKIWYPYPYGDVIGGLRLYALVIVVDIVSGPLLTLILASPSKPRREMLTDITIVACVQLAALLYGLHAVAVSRPVVIAFETDRFNVVSAAQIDSSQLNSAPPILNSLSWSGVRRVALRSPIDNEEKMLSITLSLRGVPPSARPDWWLPDNENEHHKIVAKMKPLKELLAKRPEAVSTLNKAVKQARLPESELYYLPLTSDRVKEWVVLMDKETRFKAYAPVDGFD